MEQSTPILPPVGMIYKSSWGYDQTNVDFYEIVARRGKTMVELRPVASDVIEDGPGRYRLVAIPGEYTGASFRRKVQTYGDPGYVSIASYASATPWSGTPAYDTIAAGDAGH